MIGAICTRDILSHPFVTIECFGWKTFFRALLAGQKQTFLSLLSDNALFASSANPEATAILKQCIDLELRAEHLYITLARATLEEPALALFFATLAEQEQEHADLLRLCLAASNQSGWRMGVLLAWRDDLMRLDEEMYAAEVVLSSIDDVEDALRLVLKIETSEVNRVFLAAMSASNSAFVKKLRPFQTAVETHVNYITTQVAALAPSLWRDLNPDGLACSCAAK